MIERGTIMLRLDAALATTGLRIGNRTERTVPVTPGAVVSDRSAGGHYVTARPLVLRAGARRVELANVDLRISGGNGTLRADGGGERVSVAKLRHATITSEPGRIRIANGRLRLSRPGAAALRRALALTALKARTVLGFATVDVATRPDAR